MDPLLRLCRAAEALRAKAPEEGGAKPADPPRGQQPLILESQGELDRLAGDRERHADLTDGAFQLLGREFEMAPLAGARGDGAREVVNDRLQPGLAQLVRVVRAESMGEIGVDPVIESVRAVTS